MKIAIIGAGITGIDAATYFLEHNIDFTIYERLAKPGGVWYHYANPSSRVQIPGRDYKIFKDTKWRHFYPNRGEILQEIDRKIKQLGLAKHIKYNCDVNLVKQKNGKWKINGQLYDGLYLATGLLSKPVRVYENALDPFEVDNVDITGKKILVIGQGSYAMEMIKKFQEKPFSSFTLVCRRPRWVAPLWIYLLSIRMPQWFISYIVSPLLKFKYRKSGLKNFMPSTNFKQEKVSLCNEFFKFHKNKNVKYLVKHEDKIEKMKEEYDIVIAATGFKHPDYSFIEGVQIDTSRHLYLYSIHPDYDNLIFANAIVGGRGSNAHIGYLQAWLLQQLLTKEIVVPKEEKLKWIKSKGESKYFQITNSYNFIKEHAILVAKFYTGSWWKRIILTSRFIMLFFKKLFIDCFLVPFDLMLLKNHEEILLPCDKPCNDKKGR